MILKYKWLVAAEWQVSQKASNMSTHNSTISAGTSTLRCCEWNGIPGNPRKSQKPWCTRFEAQSHLTTTLRACMNETKRFPGHGGKAWHPSLPPTSDSADTKHNMYHKTVRRNVHTPKIVEHHYQPTPYMPRRYDTTNLCRRQWILSEESFGSCGNFKLS
jgi:hypothetical protein